MSNALGSTSGSNTTQLDSLVNSYRQTLQPRLDTIKKRQTTIENKQKFYTSLNSKMNSVISTLDRFDKKVNKDLEEKFLSKTSNSSASDTVSVKAKNGANIGTNSLKVNRLATSDLLVSNQVSKSELMGLDAGVNSFDITVNGVSKTYEVTLDGTETNEQAVNKIIKVINSDKDSKITASVINDTSNTLRMTTTSKTSGQDNKIEFSDSSLLAKLGLTSILNSDPANRKSFDSTTAGYRVGNSNNLNSEIIIEGITVTRNSNTLADVLPDIDINLLKAQKEDDLPITITTTIDTAPIEKLIEPLINAYNDIMGFVRQDAATRRTEPTLGQLFTGLRNLPSEKITSATEGAPNYITNIGITVDSNGVMKITNKELLKKVLEENPSYITDVFLSEDGFVSKMNKVIERLKGDNGLLKSRRDNLQTQLDNTVSQFKTAEKNIDTQLVGVRKRYAAMLETYLNAQSQYGTATTVSNSLFGGG
jgi:flagellar hook-associated protein 2